MSVQADQLAWIAEWAGKYGVAFHHCGDSRRCIGARGFPDLVLAGPGGLAFPELKSSPWGVTPDQRTWQWTLRAAGARSMIWLPSHFRSGEAEAVIAEIGRGDP